MLFRNRADAGRRLTNALANYKSQRPVILALPRGGVVVAAEIAAAFNAPLDLILVRKIGVPIQTELAMGAVVDGKTPIIVRNDDVIEMAGVDEGTFRVVCEKEMKEIERRRQRYLGDRGSVEINGRVAIVVDDGIATGATARAALRATRLRQPSKIVLAVPVASTHALVDLRDEVDEIVCLENPEFFDAIGAYYADFSQVSDNTVIEVIRRFAGHVNSPKVPAA
jgi:putative phosphoribosyl transferase